MSKRLRSLASVLWDPDGTPDMIFSPTRVDDLKQTIQKLEDDILFLRKQVTALQRENELLKVPRPMPTLHDTKPWSTTELLREWPTQTWVTLIPKDVVSLPRLSQEVLPDLRSTQNAKHRILFDLSPKTVANRVCQHGRQCIQKLFSKHPAVFKIGICRNPVERWSHPLYGYALDTRECWLGMKVIAVFKTSCSAALLETALIHEFQKTPGCRNDKPGGETPSPVDGPHFTYVVYRILVPPTKVRSLGRSG